MKVGDRVRHKAGTEGTVIKMGTRISVRWDDGTIGVWDPEYIIEGRRPRTA